MQPQLLPQLHQPSQQPVLQPHTQHQLSSVTQPHQFSATQQQIQTKSFRTGRAQSGVTDADPSARIRYEVTRVESNTNTNLDFESRLTYNRFRKTKE